MSVPFSVPPFEHDQKLHDLTVTSDSKKQFRATVFVLVFLLLIIAIPVSTALQHKKNPLLDPYLDNLLIIIAFFLLSIYFSAVVKKVNKPETAPLYVRYDSHDFSKNLEYMAQIRLVVIAQIILVSLGCGGIVTWNFSYHYPWIDGVNPWFLHTHGHTRLATTCFVGYLALLLGLLLIVFTPSCSIRFSVDRVCISTRFIFVHWTRTLLNRTWDELETIRFVQSEDTSYYILKIDSIAHNSENIVAQTSVPSGNHAGTVPKPYTSNWKRFSLPKTLIIDPCWLTYVARVMIQLPDAGARQGFLDNLVNYTPPGTKVRYKKW